MRRFRLFGFTLADLFGMSLLELAESEDML